MKVLITGSRDWTDWAIIERELGALPPGTIVVHGDCRQGADAIVDTLCRVWRVEVRRYPADWAHGRSAGPRRNAEMVAAEHKPEEPIDLCLAFPLGASRGTRGCMRLAAAVGIPVRDCSAEEPSTCPATPRSKSERP